MNDTLTNKKLTPKAAVIIYINDSQRSYYSVADNYYLETREIKQVNGSYTFMAPTAFKMEMLRNIALNFSKKNLEQLKFDGLVPEQILMAHSTPGLKAIMWYKAAGDRLINFSEALNIKGDCRAQIPALLFLILNNKLYIFGLIDNKRPTENTKLYHAPFFNIYDDGNVCLGTAKIGSKTKTFEEEAERYERGFFMASQNSLHNVGTKLPIVKLWKELIKKPQPFPSKKALIQHKKYKTLGLLINNLIGI